jgi:predicted GNAT superfamily acetyltransferase
LDNAPSATLTAEEIRIAPCRQLSDFHAAEAVQDAVWQGGPQEVVPYHIMIAIADSGGTVIGAWEQERMVGMALSFVVWENGKPHHYSHLLGVLPAYRRHNVGMRLKLAQREFVLAQGMRMITWTFDPLESVNAFLNFAKLGVVSRTYKTNYYGLLSDQLNQGLPSDRLLVEWHLDSSRVSTCAGGQPYCPALNGTEVLLVSVDAAGLPSTVNSACNTGGNACLIEIPASIQQLKTGNASAALAWRLATREAFTSAFGAGYAAAGYRPPHLHRPDCGCYLLERA